VSNVHATPVPQGDPGAGGCDADFNNQVEGGAAAELVEQLAQESRQFDATGADPERNCWLVVHRHHHGVLPSEYDIREIPEDLYLAVLAARRASDLA
jgi:hypothetical protein